jgi:signal transduction histidine kinase
MSRRILLQTSAPAVLVGLTLLGVCLAGTWSVSRLQSNLAHILSDNVASLEAAQELEIRLRQLRFHSLLYVADPTAERRKVVEEDHRAFEVALAHARLAAVTDEEHAKVEEIEEGYRLYRAELQKGATHGKTFGRDELLRYADAHPVHHLAVPCHQLLRINKEAMNQTARESQSLGEWTRWGMFALGLIGTGGGLIVGLGIARGLSRSVARLEVRVQDVRAQLGHDVATVRLPEGGGFGRLERQLDEVVGQVRAVVAQVHSQQQEVLRAEQLAAVGRLAASVAHEIRNPLTAIKMLVGAALRGSGLSTEDLRVIHGEVVRLERTVQHLLDLARPSQPRREPTDLGQCVEQAVGAVRVRAEQQGVAVRVEWPEEPVVAEIDGDQFRGVLVNLLLNALDAMPQGGTAEVSLEGGRGGVRLAVRDTGSGIPPAVLDRLFTPFVSSKPTGTGLGLSTCRRVLQQHGGTITGGNRPGGGAEFVLTLPSQTGEPSSEAIKGR